MLTVYAVPKMLLSGCFARGAYHHVASVPALLSRPVKMRATQTALLPQQLGGHHRQKRDDASESKCHRNEMRRSP
jgi:hypothetical protein